MARADDDNADDRDVPELDAEDRALVAKLRALPPEGEEPSWQELAASIRAQVASEPGPLPWWRNWRWLAPIGLLAATAAIALVVIRSTDRASSSATTAAVRDAGVREPRVEENVATDAEHREPAPALWLDGEALDLDDIEISETEIGTALDVPGDVLDEGAEAGADDADDHDATIGRAGTMLPITNYGWIDSLDDDAAARAERWLERKRS